MAKFEAWVVEFPYTVDVSGDECKPRRTDVRKGRGVLFVHRLSKAITTRVLFLPEKGTAYQGTFFALDEEKDDGTPILPPTRTEYDKPQGPLRRVARLTFSCAHMRVALEAPQRLEAIRDMAGACNTQLWAQ